MPIKWKGLNDEWIEFGTRRYVTFTNVDPDHYIFKVKACNNDGVWNEEGIAIDITITPPILENMVVYRLECTDYNLTDFYLYPNQNQYAGETKCVA